MKQYLVDQLRPHDYGALKAHLDNTLRQAGLPGIYRLPIPSEMLTGTQLSHITCKPFYAAIELQPDAVSCEFLIRSETKLRCACMEYANREQRNWVMDQIDAILEKLEIRI
jgi:hypothetical protein